MHEVSIAQSIVRTVLNEAKKQKATHVESVEIEIGELTFLGIDQLEFWVKTAFEKTIAEKTDLIFKQIKGKLRCKDCGYKGNLKIKEDPAFHMNLPMFSCPNCQSSRIQVTQGKEALIRRIKILKK